MADSEKLNDKFSDQFDWQDRSKYSTIKKYSETNPFQNLKGIADFSTRVSDIVYNSMNKIKAELKEEVQDTNQFKKIMENLQKGLSQDMASDLRTLSLNHFVVQRETIETRSMGKEEAGGSAIPSEISDVKRNLNKALEEAAIDDEDEEYNEIDRLTRKLESKILNPDREKELQQVIKDLEKTVNDLQDRLILAERNNRRGSSIVESSSQGQQGDSNLRNEVDTLKRENRNLKEDSLKLNREIERLGRLADQSRSNLETSQTPSDWESHKLKLEEWKGKLRREKELSEAKEKEISKLRDSNVMLKHRISDLEKGYFEEKKNRLGKKEEFIVDKRFVDDQESLRRESVEKVETGHSRKSLLYC